jgi:hypothetical protein
VLLRTFSVPLRSFCHVSFSQKQNATEINKPQQENKQKQTLVEIKKKVFEITVGC